MGKKFNWKSIIFVAVALCVLSALFFLSAFFTVDTAYYEVSKQGFVWLGTFGSCLCLIWAIPYVIKYIIEVFHYFRNGY